MRTVTTIISAALIATALVTTGCGRNKDRDRDSEHPSSSMPARPALLQAQLPGPGQESRPAPGAEVDPQELRERFSRIVEDYVAAVAKENDGTFVIHDDVPHRDWKLKLARIHKDKIVLLGENRYFACADFDELGGGAKLDLDFYASGPPEWKVTEALIHKVNGSPRYTYDENNKRAPVNSQKPGNAASDEGRRPLRAGDAAPDFSLRSVDGKVVQLSTYKNGTVVMWFTNLCPGCQAAVPGIVKAHKNYSKKGVAFLAISLLGEDTQTVRAVMRKRDIPFPFLLDPKGKTYLTYGGIQIQPGTCPINPQFFIVNKGKVAYATHFPGTPEPEIWRSLDRLINPGKQKAPKEHPGEHPR